MLFRKYSLSWMICVRSGARTWGVRGRNWGAVLT